MRYAHGHKEAARERIINGVGKGFRKLGFGGIGVDGLAKEAGVTSGAFYGHFKSKPEAFRVAIATGLQDLRKGIEHFQTNEAGHWPSVFTTFYLSERRTCDLAESCALQSLTAEVGRADQETKTVFETELLEIIDTVRNGLGKDPDAAEKSWGLLALLTGGVTLARAVNDPALAEQIAQDVKRAASRLVPDIFI